jgi:hypothetical protein
MLKLLNWKIIFRQPGNLSLPQATEPGMIRLSRHKVKGKSEANQRLRH